MLALHHLAGAQGKPSVASWSEPFVVAPALHVPARASTWRTKPADFPEAPDVMVTFDCGSLDRLGDLGRAGASRGRADRPRPPRHQRPLRHDQRRRPRRRGHRRGRARAGPRASAGRSTATPPCASTPAWSPTPAASSTTNTTPEVFALAEELAAFDLPIADITRQLFEEHRFAYLQLVGACLARAELDRDLRLRGHVGHELTTSTASASTIDETEGLIDLVRRTAEAEVVVRVKETPEGIRVSLRSVVRPRRRRRRRRASAAAATSTPPGSRAPYPVRRACSTAIKQALRGAARRAVGVDRRPASSSTSRPGWTSHDVVAKCRGIFGQKRVGHSGTLDPDATGVLLVGLGRVTRLLRFLTDLPKSYTGEVVLGVADVDARRVGRGDGRRTTCRRVARTTCGPRPSASPATSSRCRRWCRR